MANFRLLVEEALEKRNENMGHIAMLFHNRSVKAAMRSVIVNGGVRLSGGKSLVIPN